MKKLILIAIVAFVTTSSCSLFKSKDALLTEEDWILYSRLTITGLTENTAVKNTLFKKSDEVVVLMFNKDGTLDVRENNGDKFSTGFWRWKSDDKEYIVINYRDYSGELCVHKLNCSDLEWSKLDVDSGSSVRECFKHEKDKDWNDATVDVLNKVL